MNWYKKSTRSIRFSENLQQQVDQIVEQIVDYFRVHNEVPKEIMRVGTIASYNHFHNIPVVSRVFLTNKCMESGSGAFRDRKTGDIFINVFCNGFTLTGEEKEAVSRLKYKIALGHEINHSSDAKINKNMFYDHEDEFLRPTEFDAYSKSIIEAVKTLYNKGEEESNFVKNALRLGNVFMLADGMDDYFTHILIAWEEKNPEYIKTLLKRIYNEVINENNAK